MRTMRWICGCTVALVLSWGYGLAQGSDAEVRALLHDQNRHAAAYLSAHTSLAHVVVALEYLLEESDLQNPAGTAALTALADPTSTALAEMQFESIEALVAAEERIVELLGDGSTGFRPLAATHHEVVGVVGGALVILSLFGGSAAVALAATEPFEMCRSQFDEPSEILECIVEVADDASLDALKAFAAAIGLQAVIAAVPHGTVKTVLEGGHAAHSAHEIYLFGASVCQDAGSDGHVPPVDPGATAMRVSLSVAQPGDLFAGRPNVEGLLHGVPVGEWVFVAFDADHARAVTECVIVQEGAVTELRLDLTPIAEISLDVDGVLVADTCPEELDSSAFDLYMFAGRPGRFVAWEGYYCQYSQNAETGRSSLLQPVLVPGGEGGADFTLYFRQLDRSLVKAGVAIITDAACYVDAEERTHFCGEFLFENGSRGAFDAFWNDGGP